MIIKKDLIAWKINHGKNFVINSLLNLSTTLEVKDKWKHGWFRKHKFFIYNYQKIGVVIMFSTIENKFKKLSFYYKNIKLLFILFILYFVFGCSILQTKKIWLFIIFVILLCLITYLYVISENIKMKVIFKE